MIHAKSGTFLSLCIRFTVRIFTRSLSISEFVLPDHFHSIKHYPSFRCIILFTLLPFHGNRDSERRFTFMSHQIESRSSSLSLSLESEIRNHLLHPPYPFRGYVSTPIYYSLSIQCLIISLISVLELVELGRERERTPSRYVCLGQANCE